MILSITCDDVKEWNSRCLRIIFVTSSCCVWISMDNWKKNLMKNFLFAYLIKSVSSLIQLISFKQAQASEVDEKEIENWRWKKKWKIEKLTT